jgi:hypothetical protein
LTSHQLLNQLTRENLRKRFKKVGWGVKAGKAMIKTESVAAKTGVFPDPPLERHWLTGSLVSQSVTAAASCAR